MSLSAGTKLGPYEILAPIGAGGMGEVYRARDLKLARDVAIKVLPESFARDAERMARFEREAQVLASLNHPNIATIYGLEEGNDVRALVMELVEGPTLAERIGHRAMPLDEVSPIAKQVAEGLEYAHERGIIHRDLKPSNVKLTADGNVKILDFGLAKAMDTPTPQGNPSISPTLTLEGTRAGVILGTAAYMAPEQARGSVVDKRADIWAFGVVLYEMLTGKQPFAGATVSDTLAAVLRGEPEWGAIPATRRLLVRRCLEKDPKRRLRDIGEARLALDESPEITRYPAPRRSVLWAAVGGLTVALAVSLWFSWRSAPPPSHPLMRFSVDLGPAFVVTGTGASLILSPDETRLVYTGRGADGKVRLYTRRLGQEDAVPLAGTEDAFSPFFSPDGQSLGFFAGGKLKKISAEGGGAVELCDAPDGRGGSWGEDGNIIAALSIRSGLSRVPSGGGPVEPVTGLKEETKEFTHRWPQVLPGARAVLFTASAGGFGSARVEVQSLPAGRRKTLVRGGHFARYAPSGHLLYLRQGVLYAAQMDVKRLELTGAEAPVVEGVTSSFNGSADFDFSRNGTLAYVKGKEAKRTLVWLESTGRIQSLRGAAGYFGQVRFSPDGKRLAVGVVEGGNVDLWVYEWERDTMIRLTFEPGYDIHPVWSPDGKHIAFASDRHAGAWNLYWIRADGAGTAMRLTESMNNQIPFSFSPDGKRLAFQEQTPQTKSDLWTLPLEEVESDHPKVGKPEPFLQTPFAEYLPQISPDGRWLAYVSEESGTSQVYVQQFPGPGGKWQISPGGGNSPVWSRQRKELFYGSSEGVMVSSYTANRETFVSSKPHLWAAKKGLGAFDLEPDGKRFAVVEAETSEQKGPTHVTFLLNFFDELRRRAPAGGK